MLTVILCTYKLNHNQLTTVWGRFDDISCQGFAWSASKQHLPTFTWWSDVLPVVKFYLLPVFLLVCVLWTPQRCGTGVEIKSWQQCYILSSYLRLATSHVGSTVTVSINWSVLVEILIVFPLLKILSSTNNRNYLNQSTPSVLILPFCQRLGLPSGLIPLNFSIKIVYALLGPALRATLLAYLILLDMNILVVILADHSGRAV
jgi:hypothetical protein